MIYEYVNFKTNDNKKTIIFQINDITENTQINNMLISENEKIIFSNKVTTELFAKLNHELKNPLQSILGISELLGDMETKLDTDSFKLIEHLKSATDHLLFLINTNMDNIRSIEYFDEKNFKNIKLHDFISDCHNFMSSQIEKKRIRFINKIDDNTIIHSDIKCLKQVLINILSNSVKYNYNDGKIEISYFFDNFHHIIINDTGIGMTQKQITNASKLYTRFADNSELGHGMGLSITQNIITFLGGTINITSEKDKGTSIEVILPK